MIHDMELFRKALKVVLLADDGLSIESEGSLYIRSLEGNHLAVGQIDTEGAFVAEEVFHEDADAAIEYFIAERERLNHGSEW